MFYVCPPEALQHTTDRFPLFNLHSDSEDEVEVKAHTRRRRASAVGKDQQASAAQRHPTHEVEETTETSVAAPYRNTGGSTPFTPSSCQFSMTFASDAP